MSTTQPDTSSLWWRWLVLALGVVLAFGVSLMILQRPWQAFFEWLVFGSDPVPDEFSPAAVDYLRFTYGVLGAVIAGWMAAMLGVALGPLRRGDPWAWRTVAGSLVFWFAIDSVFSLASGYPENAVLNCVFLAVLAPGVVGTRPGRRPKP